MNQPEAGPLPTRAATPVHLWIVGVLALLWNGFAGLDFTMTLVQNPSYLAAFTAEQLAYFDAIPAWAKAAWGLGVWGGIIGSVLLLLRRRHAAPVFLASLAGVVVLNVYSLALADAPESMSGPAAMALAGVIFLIAVGLALYARALATRDVLT